MSGRVKKPQSEYGSPGAQAQTFTLRIWVTGDKETPLDWRGRIQHVQSGDVGYCQNWDAFIAYVENVLRKPPDN